MYPPIIKIGVDICEEALAKAKENSEPELFHMLQPKEKDSSLSIFLFQANILKDLKFLLDYDIEAITSIEVVEHLKREDIDTFALNIFGILSPKYVILTTPNYNFNYWFDPTQR